MSIARIARTLAVTAVAAVLAGTTYGAQAARAPGHQTQVHLAGHHHLVGTPHHQKYSFRELFPLGMHCHSMNLAP